MRLWKEEVGESSWWRIELKNGSTTWTKAEQIRRIYDKYNNMNRVEFFNITGFFRKKLVLMDCVPYELIRCIVPVDGELE